MIIIAGRNDEKLDEWANTTVPRVGELVEVPGGELRVVFQIVYRPRRDEKDASLVVVTDVLVRTTKAT